jgi:phosphate starvation-inducible PhoH-like protein
VFDAFYSGKNLLLTGSAGTGKTFVAAYLALSEVFEEPDKYQSVTIVRSVVPSRDMGFIPGKIEEKQMIYELPYRSIFQEMSSEDDRKSYESLKSDGIVNFISTSFIRGITLRKSIVIVDEMQNLTFHELDSIVMISSPDGERYANCQL